MKKLFFAIIMVLSSVAIASAVSPKAISDNDRQALITNAKRPYVLDFSAVWCGPCRVFGPIFKEVANATDNVDFYTVDVDKCPTLASMYRIQAVPTVIVVNPTTKASKIFQGVVDKQTLVDAIKSVQ